MMEDRIRSLCNHPGQGALELSQEAALRADAETQMDLGNSCDLQQQPQQAEVHYRQALRIYTQLLKETGSGRYARAAEEACFSLADSCMQQGNMHGADFYYGQALNFRSASEETAFL